MQPYLRSKTSVDNAYLSLNVRSLLIAQGFIISSPGSLSPEIYKLDLNQAFNK